VRVGQATRCFVLDHDAALDEHVDAVHANLPATKENLDSEFSLDVQTALRECNLERATVDALHKAGPECVIDLVNAPMISRLNSPSTNSLRTDL